MFILIDEGIHIRYLIIPLYVEALPRVHGFPSKL